MRCSHFGLHGYPYAAHQAADASNAHVLVRLLELRASATSSQVNSSSTTHVDTADGEAAAAVERLQRGAIDCLARTLCAQLDTPSTEAAGSQLSELLLVPGQRAHALAVIGMATRMLHARGGGSHVAPLATVRRRNGMTVRMERAHHMMLTIRRQNSPTNCVSKMISKWSKNKLQKR